MTIQDLGSLGEFLAAIATIVTLVYLAAQIRQNTQVTRGASFQAVYDSMNQVNLAVVQNDELTRVWLAGSQDRASLNPEERHKFDFTLLSYFHVFETLHYQAQLGTGASDLVTAEERSLRAIMATPGVRQWWFENPYAFRDEFRVYIDELSKSVDAVDGGAV